jgi:hypothetical protein
LVFASDRADGKWNRVFLASLDKDGGVRLAEMRPNDRQPGKVTLREVTVNGRLWVNYSAALALTQYKKIEAVSLDISYDNAREFFLSVAGRALQTGELDLLYQYFTTNKQVFRGWGGLATDENGVSLASLAGAIATLSDEARASLQPATHGEEGAWPFEQLAAASQTDDARTDDASQQPVTDNDQDSSHVEQVAIASNTEDARTADDAQQPATDDDGDASQEQVATASDSEDAPTYAAQQPATDDDGDASQEQVATASDSEDAPTYAAQQPATDDDGDASLEEVATASDSEEAPADDAVMQTAKAEVVINPTLDDQAAPHLATSAPVTPDDGFSFSMFPKQGVPAEVAKEGMSAEQLSPETMSTPGTPAGESAYPDAASVEVGNAAPSKDPVLHHGDLAP